jgi:hypothetical protein
MISNNSSLRSSSCQQDFVFLDKYVDSLSHADKKITNYLLALTNNYDKVTVSQKRIAKKVKVSRKTANESTTKISKYGLVTKKDRGFDKSKYGIKFSCLYEVSPQFRNPLVRKRYAHIFPALRYQITINSIQSVKDSLSLNHNLMQDEEVTGLSISPNCLFINNNILPTGIEYLRRKSLPLRETNTTYVGNTTTIRKSYGQKKSLKVNRSLLIEKVSNLNSIVYSYPEFNEEAKRQLAVFPDKVHVEAMKVMAGKVGLVNPFGYYRSVCIKICQKYNISYQQPDEGLGKPLLSLPIRTKPTIQQPAQRKETKYQPLAPALHYNWTETKEFNVKRLNDYIGSAEVDAYILEWGKKGSVSVKEKIDKFQKQMNDHNQEYMTRMYKHCYSNGQYDLMKLAEQNHPYLKELGIAIPDNVPSTNIEDLVKAATPKKVNNNLDTLYEILKKYGTPEPVKNEPESITPNEEDYDEVLD